MNHYLLEHVFVLGACIHALIWKLAHAKKSTRRTYFQYSLFNEAARKITNVYSIILLQIVQKVGVPKKTSKWY